MDIQSCDKQLIDGVKNSLNLEEVWYLIWQLDFLVHWEKSFFESKKHFFDIGSKKIFLWIKDGFFNLKKISLIQRHRFGYTLKKSFLNEQNFL